MPLFNNNRAQIARLSVIWQQPTYGMRINISHRLTYYIPWYFPHCPFSSSLQTGNPRDTGTHRWCHRNHIQGCSRGRMHILDCSWRLGLVKRCVREKWEINWVKYRWRSQINWNVFVPSIKYYCMPFLNRQFLFRIRKNYPQNMRQSPNIIMIIPCFLRERKT